MYSFILAPWWVKYFFRKIWQYWWQHTEHWALAWDSTQYSLYWIVVVAWHSLGLSQQHITWGSLENSMIHDGWLWWRTLAGFSFVSFVGCWCSCSCGCRFVRVGFWFGFPLLVLFVGCWRSHSCGCSCRLVGVGFWEGGRQRGQGKDKDGKEDTLGHFEWRRWRLSSDWVGLFGERLFKVACLRTAFGLPGQWDCEFSSKCVLHCKATGREDSENSKLQIGLRCFTVSE